MFGYQGWFGTDNDGLPGYGYRHWSQDGGQPRPSSRENLFHLSIISFRTKIFQSPLIPGL